MPVGTTGDEHPPPIDARGAHQPTPNERNVGRRMRLSYAEVRDRGQRDPHLAADSGYARLLRHVSPWVSGVIVTRTRLSADAVTGCSIATGIAGAVLVPIGSPATNLAAVLLLQTAFLLDVADGEVARIRGTASRRGKYLDLVGHVIQNRALFAASGIALVSATDAALWAVALALIAQGLATPFGFYARLYVLGVADQPDPDHPTASRATGLRGPWTVSSAYQRVSFLWNVPASTNLFCVALIADAGAQLTTVVDRPIVLPAFFAVFGTTLAVRQLANAIRLGARARWDL